MTNDDVTDDDVAALATRMFEGLPFDDAPGFISVCYANARMVLQGDAADVLPPSACGLERHDTLGGYWHWIDDRVDWSRSPALGEPLYRHIEGGDDDTDSSSKPRSLDLEPENQRGRR